MIATCVYVFVKDEYIDDFIEACKINHDNSVREPGNLRFDVLQDAENVSKFLLYEAYETAEAAAAHKNTQHYIDWREKVADWMAKPREGVRHNILFPQK